MLALPEEYAAYRSAYLTAGYHEDAASLDEVQITRNAIRGSFRMTSRFEARRAVRALGRQRRALGASARRHLRLYAERLF